MPKKYIFIALLTGLLAISLAVAYVYMKRQEQSAHRYHLLCEVLEPGMSEDEVLNVLHQAGEFTMSRSEGTGGSVELGINFTDIKGRDLYGGFELWFKNDKYFRAYISGFDYAETICAFTQSDITQPINTVTETPKH
jgi:hypothetical protein